MSQNNDVITGRALALVHARVTVVIATDMCSVASQILPFPQLAPIASSMLLVRSWVRSVLATSRGSSTLDRLTDMMMESEFTIECCVRRHHIYKRRSLLGRQEPPLQSSCTYSANSSSMCEIVPRPQRQ